MPFKITKDNQVQATRNIEAGESWWMHLEEHQRLMGALCNSEK